MTEAEALEQIVKRCRTTDYEINGVELHKILCEFLRSNGFKTLAEAAESVNCWWA